MKTLVFDVSASPTRATNISVTTKPVSLKKFIRPILLLEALYALVGCSPQGSSSVLSGAPPPSLIGEYIDDYGIEYSLSDQEWHQYPSSIYRIVLWRTDAQYLIAQNDAANPSDAGLWTRIDWMELSGMPPYEWAFCLSAYAAATAAEAEATTIAQREMPRTGCNNHPFSRMRSKDAESL